MIKSSKPLPPVRIILFRGLFGGIFSTGMDDLADKLAKLGLVPTVHRWTERACVEQKLIKAINSGKHKSGIAIIGHSLGANAATILANGLIQSNFIPVYLATLDPTKPRTVIAPLPADNFRSSFVLATNCSQANNHFLPELTHTQLDNSPIVHDYICQRLINLGLHNQI